MISLSRRPLVLFLFVAQVFFLATQSFAQDKIIAKVLDKEISINDLAPDPRAEKNARENYDDTQYADWEKGYARGRLSALIVGTLFGKYAVDNKLQPTEEEIKEFIVQSDKSFTKQRKDLQVLLAKDKKDLESKDLSADQRKNLEKTVTSSEKILKSVKSQDDFAKNNKDKMAKIKRNIAMRMIQAWKINKSLFDQYRGRVIFQQAGPEPLDAYRIFLKKQEEIGAFKLIDKTYTKDFWNYYVNDKMHNFYSMEKGVEVMKTPWWLMKGK